MLVVLDNARDTVRVRPLLSGTCLAPVTSRNQLTVDLLAPAEAR